MPDQSQNLFDPHDLVGSVPHFDQWLGDWAMEETRFLALAEMVRGVDLSVHLAAGRSAPPPVQNFATLAGPAGNIAVIELAGTLMKQQASMEQSTSTVLARRMVRAAAADPNIQAILLAIDSPGGTVAGTGDLAADVAAANRQKPVYAQIDDLGASAAYWIASQARAIFANATALVGSIGTYGVVYDQSARAAMAGLKVHVIRAGARKGSGTAGTEITPDDLAERQTIVDQLNSHFLAGVASGRNLPIAAVSALADGRVHLAAVAQALGLIDGVQSFDQTLAAIQSALSVPKRGLPMSTAIAGAPATYDEIVAECIGADAEFIVDQLKGRQNIDQARKNWMAAQGLRLEESAQATAAVQRALDEKTAAAATPRPGVEPVSAPGAGSAKAGDNAGDGSARQRWNEAVSAAEAKGLKRPAAIACVVRHEPQLHADYLAEANVRVVRGRRAG